MEENSDLEKTAEELTDGRVRSLPFPGRAIPDFAESSQAALLSGHLRHPESRRVRQRASGGPSFPEDHSQQRQDCTHYNQQPPALSPRPQRHAEPGKEDGFLICSLTWGCPCFILHNQPKGSQASSPAACVPLWNMGNQDGKI